jgi:hypothetical protein
VFKAVALGAKGVVSVLRVSNLPMATMLLRAFSFSACCCRHSHSPLADDRSRVVVRSRQLWRAGSFASTWNNEVCSA